MGLLVELDREVQEEADRRQGDLLRMLFDGTNSFHRKMLVLGALETHPRFDRRTVPGIAQEFHWTVEETRLLMEELAIEKKVFCMLNEDSFEPMWYSPKRFSYKQKEVVVKRTMAGDPWMDYTKDASKSNYCHMGDGRC
jgi:hypothetical protein